MWLNSLGIKTILPLIGIMPVIPKVAVADVARRARCLVLKEEKENIALGVIDLQNRADATPLEKMSPSVQQFSFMPSKKGFSKGATLIEVMMAAIIASMATTAIYSVVLSSFVSVAKADKREASSLIFKKAQNTLKSYVAVEVSNTIYDLPGKKDTPGVWEADTSGKWALSGNSGSPGKRHDISSLLKGTVFQPGLTTCGWGKSCHLVYYVKNDECGIDTGGTADHLACKTVKFELKYAD